MLNLIVLYGKIIIDYNQDMSLDIAYSLEIDEYIDPDKAHDLYWKGDIKNKKKFICPGTNCYAQITCANIDKDYQSMKVNPHFKIYGNHHKDCEIYNKKPLKYKYILTNNSKSGRNPIIESNIDNFLLKRPISYYNTNKTGKMNGKKSIRQINRKKALTISDFESISSIYSVRTIVSRYNRYKSNKLLNTKKISINGIEIKYSDIFECVWEQNYEEFPDHAQVYHGWAYINRLPKDNGYQIKFKKKILYNSEKITSTIMISDRLINSYEVKKLVSSRIKKIHDEDKSTAYVFIFGKPIINQSQKGYTYVNIPIDNLDLIDINYADPLKEINN